MWRLNWLRGAEKWLTYKVGWAEKDQLYTTNFLEFNLIIFSQNHLQFHLTPNQISLAFLVTFVNNFFFVPFCK
jgi:hypothetical protein